MPLITKPEHVIGKLIGIALGAIGGLRMAVNTALPTIWRVLGLLVFLILVSLIVFFWKKQI